MREMRAGRYRKQNLIAQFVLIFRHLTYATKLRSAGGAERCTMRGHYLGLTN